MSVTLAYGRDPAFADRWHKIRSGWENLPDDFEMSSMQATHSYRTTHTYPGALYLLPSDDDERARLARQHQLYKVLFGGRIIFPPICIGSNSEVLDIGTGSAVWLTDCRSLLPESVQFYGIDIESNLFPTYSDKPPNTHFSVGSATALPSYWTSKFSLVNQRLLILALTKTEWEKVISEIFRVLRPGGYAQLVEIDSNWYSGPKTAAHVRFLNKFLEAQDFDLRCGEHIPKWMNAAGFVDVYTEEVTVQIGKWAGRVGEEAREASIGALRGMKGPVMKAGGLGYVTSAEEFDAKVDAVAKEWDRTEGSHRNVKVFYTMKPMVTRL